MMTLPARMTLWRRIWIMATLGERATVMLAGAAGMLIVAAVGAWFGRTDSVDPVRQACLLGGTPIAAVAILWWATFCGGAARQNSPANAALVPGLNRAVRQCVALVWVLTMLALLPLVWKHPDAAAVYPQFALAMTGVGLFRAGRQDGLVVVAAIILLYLAGLASPSFTMFLVHPLGVATASLLAIGYAAWALPRALPAGGERHWHMRSKQQLARAQNDMVEWEKSRRGHGRGPGLHGWALMRDIRNGAKPGDMLLHGLGAGSHRYHVLAMLVCGALVFLVLRAGLVLTAMPARDVNILAVTMTAAGVVAFLSMNWARYAFSIRSTAGEQAVLRMAPRMPPAASLNRVLGGRILVISLRQWLAAAALALGVLWLWDGSAVSLRTAAIVAAATLASIGISLDDYAHSREMNDWKSAFLILWVLFVLLLGIVHRDNLASWSAALVVQLATSVSYVLLRWRRMQNAPVAFPAGRLA